MINWFINIYKAFIYVSIILFIIYFSTSGEISWGALIASFCVFILSLICALILIYNNIQLITQGRFSFLYEIIKQSGPILIILGCVAYLLYLVITYKNNITSDHVSGSYHTFMNICIIIILLQIYILLQNKTERGYINITPIISGILYIFNILLFICVNFINTILKYFTTDGFTSCHNCM